MPFVEALALSRPLICGTKRGAALPPLGTVLDQFPARPRPALSGGLPLPPPGHPPRKKRIRRAPET
eukprot:1819129-Alexandrium_andersonii.AAC.1